MKRIAYDAGALIAAERNNPQLWTLHRQMLERGAPPSVSTLSLAQAWRSGRQTRLRRLLGSCHVVPFTERDAQHSGAALAASGTRDVVDASVVVSAAERGALIVTSDPKDLKALADAIGARAVFRVV